MSNGLALLSIFVLSVFIGFEVVSKVSTTLHTPLMSGANAIHGIILIGAITVADPRSLTICKYQLITDIDPKNFHSVVSFIAIDDDVSGVCDCWDKEEREHQ